MASGAARAWAAASAAASAVASLAAGGRARARRTPLVRPRPSSGASCAW